MHNYILIVYNALILVVHIKLMITTSTIDTKMRRRVIRTVLFSDLSQGFVPMGFLDKVFNEIVLEAYHQNDILFTLH